MPRVASEPSVVHPKYHAHQGPRSRSADAEANQPASPFAALVDSGDTPPPAARNRNDRGQTNRASSAQDTAPAKTSDKKECAPASDQAKAGKPDQAKTDGETAEPAEAELPVDVKAALNVELLPEQIAPSECEDDGDTAEAVENFETAVVAAATGDAETAPPPVAPPPAVTPDLVAAPIIPVLPVAAEPAPVAPDASDLEPVADGATPPPVAKNAPIADIPQAAPQTPDVPKAPIEKIAAAPTDKETSPKTTDTAEAPPADVNVKSQTTTENGKDPAPAEPVQPNNAPAAHEHERPRHRADVAKADDAPAQTLGAQVSEAAHTARPPSDAIQAVLQAADRLASLAPQAAPSATPANQEPAVPLAGLAVEIVTRAQAGHSRFEIRLDPPELGRIDVRLDVDQSGQVTSRLTVERAETLEHLRRDAAELERALQQAGLKTGDNGLQFTLRDQSFAGRDDRGDAGDAARLVVPDPELASADTLQSAYGRTWRTGGIDIRV